MTDLLCSPMNFVSCSTMLLHENKSENKKVYEMKIISCSGTEETHSHYYGTAGCAYLIRVHQSMK